MIMTRVPLRISFAGGGSDLPAYLRHAPGAVFSAAIQLYMHVALNPRPVDRGIRLAYSQTENVERAADLQHDIARAILERYHIEDTEIHSISDVPAGTGLGSSSAYAVALVLAVYGGQRDDMNHADLVRIASYIETEKLGRPIGTQDHLACTYGGIRLYEFDSQSGIVTRRASYAHALEDHLLLVSLGNTREQETILRTQAANMDDPAKREHIAHMVSIARAMPDMIESGYFQRFGEALHEAWTLKRQVAHGITDAHIDAVYSEAREAGAWGGKLCGAGGGGFMVLCVSPEKRAAVIAAMRGLRTLPVRFDLEGAKVVYSD